MSNAKQARPSIILNLDQPREFIFNLNALCTAEERLGKSIFKLVDWKNLGLKDLRLLLWAGLVSKSPELTVEEVGDMIDAVSIAGIFANLKDLINTALDAAMPHLGEEDLAAVEANKKKLSSLGVNLESKPK